MAENSMHQLKARFGDSPVKGDTRDVVLPACNTVGRPIFFSVAIMLLSFLPVFALRGIEGKMFHPLAFTKSFAMLAVALLAITLVPALCTIFVRGRLRSEEQVAVVRGLTRVYRPVLAYFLEHPLGLVWFVGLTFIVGLAPTGNRTLLLVTLAVFLVGSIVAAKSRATKFLATASLILVALIAEQQIKPLGREFMTPLDEGMVMDMPITVPRASVTQSADDLKARNMVLCRFPEVDMVVGKAGRAETATDPAPLDMIETMVNFRPPEFWPKRCLRPADAERHSRSVLDSLVARQIIQDPVDRTTRANSVAMDAVALFDAQMREAAYQKNKEFERLLGQDLTHFAVTSLLRTLAENGAFSGDQGIVTASAVVAGHSHHLAMDPSRQAVAALIGDVLRILGANGLLSSVDPLRLPSNRAERTIWTMQELLGEERPTLAARIHDQVRHRHRVRWQTHLRQVNAELLD
jgi:Cu(I)/Ag(I) efflux system membrane protein CusA/SilA